ncbi:MAG: hypothetical protein K2O16_16855 [Lachnospiraceae bacterium]|nr:hypothetical protein [Lachnospiraceae bacterium]
MKDKNEKKKRIKMLNRFERNFAFHEYSGKGKEVLEILKGTSNIAASALQSVNYFDTEKRMACPFTGGLVKLLSFETKCHIFCAEKAYNVSQKELLTNQIKEYINENDIKVLIDFYTIDENSDYVAQLWAEGKSKYRFVKKLIQYAFEYEYQDKLSEKAVIKFERNRQDTIALNTARNAKIFFVHIGLNKKYFNSYDQDKFLHVIDILIKTFKVLSYVDWKAEKIEAFRLWQSTKHKLQDKIEIYNAGEKNCFFKINSLLNICSYGTAGERVRLYKPEGRISHWIS